MEDAKKEEEEMELRKLQELAKLSNIYYRNLEHFERDTNMSHVVHAVMNFSQLACVVTIEIFHHVHHAVNRKMRENNSNVPELPEERSPIFVAYPFCVLISLIMAILWLGFRTFQRIIITTLVGCAIGVLLMVISGVMAMRHAEIYINLEEVTDDELLTHPIFIHNFIMCILSILAMLIYLIHFWILHDCWQWRKKERERKNDMEEPSLSQSSPEFRRTFEPGTSRQSETERFERSDDLDAIPTWEMLKKKLSVVDEMDLEYEPVILYCCCLDYWRYIKERELRVPIQEFQVIHVK